MKVLVVDDDVVARKVLGAFLKQSNYEMSIVEDGHSAFQALTAPDAPHVAIIDWMMPDISGPELCTKLRQHEFAVQPYLLMLSGRKEKTDIAAALDAGADDFISKPFNIQEMQARLRVATRSIQRQLQILEQVNALRAELDNLRSNPLPAAAPRPDTSPAESETPAAPRTGMALLEPYQLDIVVAGALRHAGQAHAPRRLLRSAPNLDSVAWAGVLLAKEGTWVDLFIETNPADAKALLDQARVAASSCRGPRDYCEKLQSSLRDSLASVLRAMGCEVHIPSRPLAIDPIEAALALGDQALQRHSYRVGDAEFNFAFLEQPCPRQEKSTAQLRPFDVLVAPYPPTSTHQVPLLRAGVVLKEQLIEKLQDFAAATIAEVPPVPVHTPSAVALQLLERSASAGRV